ncbi:MAG TPA: hypothetical protein PLV64_17030 [Anaerolineales bacterium]|nr:hypothetical protein [Anaerolineales bacterium]
MKFIYLYRDGANYKSLGEVTFNNPDKLPLDEINKRLSNAFLTDGLFVAHQVSIPEVFLFLNSKFTEHDHCYHEFRSVEICDEPPTDSLSRSISDFLQEVERSARIGWKAFDILERA